MPTTAEPVITSQGVSLEKRTPVEPAEILGDGAIITSNGILIEPGDSYPRIVENLSNEAYHAERDHVSSSSLKCFMQSIPEYFGRYVTGEIEKPDSTPAMNLGTALHIMALEADKWPELVAVGPVGASKATNAWKDHVKANAGKCCITPDEAEAVSRMMQSVHQHPEAHALLTEPGRNELTVFWKHDSGLRCKTRFDRLTDSGTIVDIKTAADPTPNGFGKAVANMGYHYSAEFYIQAASALLTLVECPVRHIAVGNREPYETVVYELDPKFYHIARRDLADAIDELLECRAIGLWGSRHSGVVTVECPGWVR